jgi:hypothetical protein
MNLVSPLKQPTVMMETGGAMGGTQFPPIGTHSGGGGGTGSSMVRPVP